MTSQKQANLLQWRKSVFSLRRILAIWRSKERRVKRWSKADWLNCEHSEQNKNLYLKKTPLEKINNPPERKYIKPSIEQKSNIPVRESSNVSLGFRKYLRGWPKNGTVSSPCKFALANVFRVVR